jgi:hypothetical protein
MNRTTGAQRYNARMNKIWDKYHQIERERKDILPTITDYGFYLSKAMTKFNIGIDEARSKYGQFTYGEWKTLLNLW